MTLSAMLRLLKKYLVAEVIVCMIITTFIATQRKQLFQNAPSEQYIEPKKNISLKLSAEIQSRIETLVLFVGYPRSGHTLIGSLLDAHPHIVISNELDILQRWTEWTKAEKTRENSLNKMYENSYTQAQGSGFRSAAKKTGRTYSVPNQWQGKYKDYIKVVGDKKGGKTTKFLDSNQDVTNEVLDEINLPIKLVHVVRNPYDNIATMIMRSLKITTLDALAAKNKEVLPSFCCIRSTLRVVSRTKVELRHSDKIFYQVNAITGRDKNAAGNYRLTKRFGSSLLTLHSEDVIAKPKEQLKKLCQFFNVTCTEEYLDDCASIIYKSPSKTRRAVIWREADKNNVEKAIDFFPFLKRYTFDDK